MRCTFRCISRIQSAPACLGAAKRAMEKASPTASYSAAICRAAWTLGGTPTTLGGFPVPAPLRPGMVDAVHTTAMKRRSRVLVVDDDKAVLKSTIPMLDTL